MNFTENGKKALISSLFCYNCTNSTFFQDFHPIQAEEPVPEWQLQPVDEEPPDVIDLEAENEITQNIAYARLQTKTLVDIQPTSNNTAEDMVVVISDDETDIIEQPHEIYEPPHQQIQHPPPPAYHEMSLQDRLRNLAGVPIPGTPSGPPLQGPPPMHQPPPLMNQPPPMNTTRPPPPFSERPPGGPMRGGRGHRGGMNGNRGRPFHNKRGGGRGFHRGGRW